MEVNEEKRKKFMEYAGKRVNNVLHDIQILEPMSRSASYDFTKQDVDEMFSAMQETLNNAKIEFEKKFEEKARTEKKVFSFGNNLTHSEVGGIATAEAVATNSLESVSTSPKAEQGATIAAEVLTEAELAEQSAGAEDDMTF